MSNRPRTSCCCERHSTGIAPEIAETFKPPSRLGDALRPFRRAPFTLQTPPSLGIELMSEVHLHPADVTGGAHPRVSA